VHVNMKKLANEVERITGLHPTSFHAEGEFSDPDIEFGGGYMIQVSELTPDRPYVFYSETGGVITQLGDFRTQKELVEFIRTEVKKA